MQGHSLLGNSMQALATRKALMATFYNDAHLSIKHPTGCTGPHHGASDRGDAQWSPTGLGVVRLTGTQAAQAAPGVPVSMGAPCAHSSPALHVPPLRLQLAARLRAEGANAACSGARQPPLGVSEPPPGRARGRCTAAKSLLEHLKAEQCLTGPNAPSTCQACINLRRACVWLALAVHVSPQPVLTGRPCSAQRTATLAPECQPCCRGNRARRLRA